MESMEEKFEELRPIRTENSRTPQHFLIFAIIFVAIIVLAGVFLISTHDDGIKVNIPEETRLDSEIRNQG